MNGSTIRTGHVSSVNYETGMVRVLYKDRGQETTIELPYMSFNDEYSMPEEGTQVLSVHLSNGSSRGIVIGPMWNKKNKPAESGKGIYRKEMSRKKGTAYIRYSDGDGEYLLIAPNVKILAMEQVTVDGDVIEIEAGTELILNGKKMVLGGDNAIFLLPKIIIGGATEDGEAVSEIEIENKCDIKLLSEANTVDESVKGMSLKALEDIKEESEQGIGLKAGQDLEMEDASWKTTLSKIMDRLAALDGDQSDKK